MRIAFNAQLLSEPHTGTGRYIYNLLDALGRLDPSSEYHILSTRQLIRASADSRKACAGRSCRQVDLRPDQRRWRRYSGSSACFPEPRAP